MDSILTSIKKLLGVEEEDESFDVDIIFHINSVFTILTQLGVGPSEGFRINDKTSVWKDFIAEDSKWESAKSWTYLKVKLLFDPPDRAAVVESMKEMIKEFEWRLCLETDSNQIEE